MILLLTAWQQRATTLTVSGPRPTGTNRSASFFFRLGVEGVAATCKRRALDSSQSHRGSETVGVQQVGDAHGAVVYPLRFLLPAACTVVAAAVQFSLVSSSRCCLRVSGVNTDMILRLV